LTAHWKAHPGFKINKLQIEADMKILVTGNLGYVGPSVMSQLRRSYPDAALIGYDKGYFGNCLTTLDGLPERLLDMQVFGDVRKFPSELLDGVDSVVHLAGISNDPIGNMFERVTLDINYKASVELAVKAKARKVKSFVFASSCSMYGAADDWPRVETDPLNPLTAYAKSKVFTEQELKPLSAEDFVVTSLRFSTACGMSARLRLDLVLNDFVAGAVADKRITILSDGTPWRPLIDVKDMARAIDWAITREAGNGGRFLAVNVGTDRWNYQVRELAEAVAELIPGTQVSINKDAQPDKRSYRVNFALFKKLAPQHQPQVDLYRAILELKTGLEAMGFNDVDFRNSKYMRLKVLTAFLGNGLLNENLDWSNGRETSAPISEFVTLKEHNA
jgi:nucleoside-diphosphate-sugar epimerase